MRKLIRRKWRKWSGLEEEKAARRVLQTRIIDLERLYSDLVSIGVDVHFKEPHMILIYSKINGGQLRHIEASFGNLKELNEFCRSLREKYKTKMQTNDLPPGMPRGDV